MTGFHEWSPRGARRRGPAAHRLRATPLRLLGAALVAALCLAGSVAVAAPSGARPPTAADPAVVTEWNAIAVRTIFTENATPVPSVLVVLRRR